MKEEANKPRDIRERTFEYALWAIKLYQYLIKRREGAASLKSQKELRQMILSFNLYTLSLTVPTGGL